MSLPSEPVNESTAGGVSGSVRDESRQPAPVWLLDIDGVINAVAPRDKPPTHVWPAETWIDTKAMGHTKRWRILTARPVVDFIRDVHESGRAEIRWHTTWQEMAREVAQALDLPDFPVQDAPEFLRVEEYLLKDQWWKLPAVWRVLAEGRQVLWTDDDAVSDLTAERKVALAAAGCHIISPNGSTGLCERHLREIDEYLGGKS